MQGYNYLENKSKSEREYSKLLAIMDRCNITQDRDYHVIEYNDRFHSPWAANAEAEARHKFLVRTGISAMRSD